MSDDADTRPLVSLITPTFDRDFYLKYQLQSIRQQDYPALEWLVFDDSPVPSRHLSELDEDWLLYHHQTERVSIGDKRNRLIEMARGDIIVHIDDDDYYAPHYVRFMVDALEQGGYDLVKLADMFLYSSNHDKFGYWELDNTQPHCFVWSPERWKVARLDTAKAERMDNRKWGFGFSYVYRKRVTEDIKFQDRNWNEDGPFARQVRERYPCAALPDTEGLVLHVLHKSNTSSSFPQYEMPLFMLRQYFPRLIEGFLH